MSEKMPFPSAVVDYRMALGNSFPMSVLPQLHLLTPPLIRGLAEVSAGFYCLSLPYPTSSLAGAIPVAWVQLKWDRISFLAAS